MVLGKVYKVWHKVDSVYSVLLEKRNDKSQALLFEAEVISTLTGSEADSVKHLYTSLDDAYGCLGVLQLPLGDSTHLLYLVLVNACVSVGKIAKSEIFRITDTTFISLRNNASDNDKIQEIRRVLNSGTFYFSWTSQPDEKPFDLTLNPQRKLRTNETDNRFFWNRVFHLHFIRYGVDTDLWLLKAVCGGVAISTVYVGHEQARACLISRLSSERAGTRFYLRSHFQEAIDIYKKILLDHRDFLALNVYVALCYYKLDYYDVSQEVLAVYLQHYPDSVTAINLKACNHYRLYNGKAAENELRQLIDNSSPSFAYAKDLIRHNLVVFRNGEGAMQVLPGLVDTIPEARLNLVIKYLKQDDVQEAFNLIKDLEPTVPHEYILKGVVNAAYGQRKGLREFLKVAQQFFQLVGGSASECDTIPGRQCMASCFFLMKQFDDVLLYLSSIKSYFYSDDAFNFNFGQAQAATGNYSEAEEAFLSIKNIKIISDPIYISWLIRCYIMNKTPEKAWQLYEVNSSRPDSFNHLNLIANDCYKMGQFLYSARAFDHLEKSDSNPEFWEGKRGACVGLFQLIVAGKEPRESLNEVIKLLRNSYNPQVDQILRTLRNWDKENYALLK